MGARYRIRTFAPGLHPSAPLIARLRHVLVVRLVALLVGVGALAALAPAASAAERTADWLRARAVDADRAAFEAALDLALSRGNLAPGRLAPSAFLDAYAEAQPHFGAPSGAWFGLNALSFHAALDRLRGEARGSFDAPPAPDDAARMTTSAGSTPTPSGPSPLAAVAPGHGLPRPAGRRVDGLRPMAAFAALASGVSPQAPTRAP